MSRTTTSTLWSVYNEYKCFLEEVWRSNGSVLILLVSLLVAFGHSTTVGMVPATMEDRFARLNHGYTNERHCNEWSRDEDYSNKEDNREFVLPVPCREGASDARQSSAIANLVQNMLSLLCNPKLGSYSDVVGRKQMIVASCVLAIGPSVYYAALLAFPRLHPFGYYAAVGLTGIVSNISIMLAALSDSLPDKNLRTFAFGLLFACNYGGVGLAPSIPLLLHSFFYVSLIAVVFNIAALVIATALLPETLLLASNNNNNNSEENSQPLEQEQQQQEQEMGITDGGGNSSPDHSTDGYNQYVELSISASRDEKEADDDDDESAMEGQDDSLPGEIAQFRRPSLDLVQRFRAFVVWTFRDVSILNRTLTLRLITVASFLSGMVLATDRTFIFYYMEEEFDVHVSDVAVMMLTFGITGIVLQAGLLQPFSRCCGERLLLIATFASGTCHNMIFGIAHSKTTLLVGMIVAQFTKLDSPLLSSFTSKAVSSGEQGRIQGALFAVTAVASAIGPVLMEWVHSHVNGGGSTAGIMFVACSFLYGIGTLVVLCLPYTTTIDNNDGDYETATTMDPDEEGEEVITLVRSSFPLGELDQNEQRQVNADNDTTTDTKLS